MSQEKYQPTPAPLGANTLPEYVLRELRRVGNVINTGFENLEASLSALAAIPAVAVSASAGMRVYSATAGVVVLELDGANLTSRSSSQTELYYLAWDASMSHAVKVPGNAMPGGGAGGLPTGSDGHAVFYSGTTAVAVPRGGGPDIGPVAPNQINDEFETGTSLDVAGTRFTGAVAWTKTGQGGVWIEPWDSMLKVECSATGGAASGSCIFIIDSGTLSTSFILTAKFSRFDNTTSVTNFARCYLGIADASISTAENVVTGKNLQLWQVYSTGRKVELTQNPFASIAVTGSLDTENWETLPIYLRFRGNGTTLKAQYSFNGNEWIDVTTITVATYLTGIRWVTLGVRGPDTVASGAAPFRVSIDFVRLWKK